MNMLKKDGELSDEELEHVVGGSKDMKLLMENWRSYLKELENTSEVGIPKNFYISIAFGGARHLEQLMKDLANGQVIKQPGGNTGIVGFADNPSNFMQFHGTQRDATMVMPAKEFLDINDSVVKIEYDNADFLTQDGLKAIFRVVEKQQTDHETQIVLRRLMQNAANSVTAMENFLKQLGHTDLDRLDADRVSDSLDHPHLIRGVGAVLFKNLDNINDLDSYHKILTPSIMKYSREVSKGTPAESVVEKYMTPELIKLVLKDGLINTAETFKEENEWVVDSNVLNIPDSSTLYVAGPEMKTKKLFQQLKKGTLGPGAMERGLGYEVKKMQSLLDLIEKYGLDKKYKKVIITDLGVFKKAKFKWDQKRRELKYAKEKEKEMSIAAE